jgi:hypothetical protein
VRFLKTPKFIVLDLGFAFEVAYLTLQILSG